MSSLSLSKSFKLFTWCFQSIMFCSNFFQMLRHKPLPFLKARSLKLAVLASCQLIRSSNHIQKVSPKNHLPHIGSEILVSESQKDACLRLYTRKQHPCQHIISKENVCIWNRCINKIQHMYIQLSYILTFIKKKA